MIVLAGGERSATAEVARQVINSYENFPLLNDASARSRFFRGLIFGLKEQAQRMSQLHPQLASDYGDWVLKIWRVLRALRRKRNESEGAILLAMHWLEKKKEDQSDRAHLKIWWQQLQPLFTEVLREGGRPDCFRLLFQLREGEFNDLSGPEELLSLLSSFIERIRKGVQTNLVDLDETSADDEDYESWRRCSEYAAETINSFHQDGSLKNELQREEAHKLLSILAADPFRSSHALLGLHRLQTN